MSLSKSGTDWPVSHLLTLWRETSSRAASSSWERPSPVRNCRIFSDSDNVIYLFPWGVVHAMIMERGKIDNQLALEIVRNQQLRAAFFRKGEAMAKKNARNTKGRIIQAAWQLFYRQGYDDTTVEEIIEASGTSRGSFYHYFEGKDALLSSVSYLFDQKYEELMEHMDPDQNRFDLLMDLNRELFAMIENSISLDLLARLYSSQLITRGDKHLLDHNRTYYKLLREIVVQGQERGELRRDVTVSEMVRVYAMCERALIYDWCLSGGGYSLLQDGKTMMPMFFQGFRCNE